MVLRESPYKPERIRPGRRRSARHQSTLQRELPHEELCPKGYGLAANPSASRSTAVVTPKLFAAAAISGGIAVQKAAFSMSSVMPSFFATAAKSVMGVVAYCHPCSAWLESEMNRQRHGNKQWMTGHLR